MMTMLVCASLMREQYQRFLHNIDCPTSSEIPEHPGRHNVASPSLCDVRHQHSVHSQALPWASEAFGPTAVGL